MSINRTPRCARGSDSLYWQRLVCCTITAPRAVLPRCPLAQFSAEPEFSQPSSAEASPGGQRRRRGTPPPIFGTDSASRSRLCGRQQLFAWAHTRRRRAYLEAKPPFTAVIDRCGPQHRALSPAGAVRTHTQPAAQSSSTARRGADRTTYIYALQPKEAKTRR